MFVLCDSSVFNGEQIFPGEVLHAPEDAKCDKACPRLPTHNKRQTRPNDALQINNDSEANPIQWLFPSVPLHERSTHKRIWNEREPDYKDILRPSSHQRHNDIIAYVSKKEWMCLIFQQEGRRAHGQYHKVCTQVVPFSQLERYEWNSKSLLHLSSTVLHSQDLRISQRRQFLCLHKNESSNTTHSSRTEIPSRDFVIF